MAGRCGARHGKLAGALARHHERSVARRLGFGLPAREPIYGLLFASIGWRGMLWVGILPALLCLFIRTYVRESEVWEENNRKRLEQKLLAPPSAAAGRGALAGTVIGWVVGAVAVAVTIFGALKVAAPAVLTPS